MGRTRVDLVVTAAALPESPDMTRIPPSAEIIDSRGHRWWRRDIGNGNFVVMWDEATLGWQVAAMKYVSGVVWFSDSGGWHQTFYNASGVPKIGGGQANEPGVEPPPPPPPDTNHPPYWAETVFTVTEGIPTSIYMQNYAFDPDGDALTFRVVDPLNALASASGFSYDAATNRLVYDGRTLLGSPDDVLWIDSGLRVGADDGVPDPVSPGSPGPTVQ